MEAWNQAWATEDGREAWLKPEPFVADAVKRLQRGQVRRVLDLGFGVGRHAILLAQAGFEVHGIDAAANGRDYAERWAEQAGLSLTLSVGDMTTIPYPNGYFDAVLTWNVIYHGLAATIRQTIGEIGRVLQPGGWLICSLISTQNPKFGIGEEVEYHTYVIPGGGEKEHPHRYFDAVDVATYLHNFEILRQEDSPQQRADDYHWHVLARLRSGSR